MSLPTPAEMSGILTTAILRIVPLSHADQAVLLALIATGIEADRAAHCRHVAEKNGRRDWLIKQLAVCLSLFDSYPAFDPEMAALIEMTDEFTPEKKV